MYLLAPTPANTPQLAENNNNGSESLTFSPVDSEICDFSQMVDQQEETEQILEKNVITKLLFTDFPEKLEGCKSSLDEEDDESVWSVEVNASTSDEHEDNEGLELDYEDEEVDELCEELIKICVNSGDKFSAKHERFGYDYDGEIEGDA